MPMLDSVWALATWPTDAAVSMSTITLDSGAVELRLTRRVRVPARTPGLTHRTLDRDQFH